MIAIKYLFRKAKNIVIIVIENHVVVSNIE